jgi:hypothetical protein
MAAKRKSTDIGILSATNVQSISVEVTGINPLLIQRFREENEQPKETRTAKHKQIRDTRAEALSAANVASDGSHYISAFAIVNAMITTGGNHKQRGTRKSLRYLVPSAVRIMTVDGTLPIYIGSKVAKDKDVIVDARPVVIPATKGRIMRYRPKYENWSLKFDIEVSTDLISTEVCQQLLVEAGTQVGIGDFRPEKRGPFGTFRVTKWVEHRPHKEHVSKKTKKV